MKYVAMLMVLALMVSCDDSKPAAAASEKAELPATLFTTTAPPNAMEVAAAKSAQPGQVVTIRGRIGGSAEPLAANRAMLTLADLSLPTCDKIPGDQCPTPWDSCCEPADVIIAKSVTVQIAGADGKPMKTTLSGAGGIAAGKEIVVVGKASRPTDSTVIVDAHQIYVSP